MLKKYNKYMMLFIMLGFILCFYNLKALALDNVSKIYGQDSIETSIKASKYAWSNSEYVILASSENCADSLCAVPLSRNLDAPILLINQNNLDNRIEEEIIRLNCKHIVIIGGEGSISNDVQDKLKNNYEVLRICGQDRYDTSACIAKKVGNSKAIILTNGDNYVDSLSACSMAGQAGIPILLTDKDNIPNNTLEYIKESSPSKIYIVGGEGVVSNKVRGMLHNAERIGGKDRYDTNMLVFERFHQSFNFSKIFFANSENSNEVMLASMLGAKLSSPMVLINDSPMSLKDTLGKKINPYTEFVVVGDENDLKDEVINNLKINGDVLDINGKVYDNRDIKSENILIKAEDIKINNTDIKGNLYVDGNKLNLNNSSVKEDILCSIKNNETFYVNSSRINNLRILNGNSNIYFKDSVGNNISIESDDKNSITNIIGSDNFRTMGIVIKGNASLENINGKFGNISVLNEGLSEKVIQLKGDYKDAIYIQGNTTIKIDSNAKVRKLRLVASNSNARVRIEGKAQIVTFINPAFLELTSKTEIQKIEAVQGSTGTVNIPRGALVEEVTNNIKLTKSGEIPLTIVKPEVYPTE